ncbi:MAG: hypothetical protein RJQ14_17580 [Marinoscillum sp.]
MKLIDTNALIVLVLGLIDPSLISKNKRTSIYSEGDFLKLVQVIEDLDKLITIPNVWTEVDNLLNRIGYLKYEYVDQLKVLMSQTEERYLSSNIALSQAEFWSLGITDTLLLQVAKECDLLITSDSELSDFANANGINVYDMVLERNKDFF